MLDVIIPAYNEEETVARAINSALQFPFVQNVIVVNDGSADKTKEVINSFTDTRVVYVEMKQNMGLPNARYAGAMISQKISDNPYIAFVDADDYFASNGLDEAFQIIKDNPQFSCIKLNLIATGFPEIYTKHPKFHEIMERWQLYTMTGIFNREIFLKVGHMVSGMKIGEDFCLMSALKSCTTVAMHSNYGGTHIVWHDNFTAKGYIEEYLYGTPNVIDEKLIIDSETRRQKIIAVIKSSKFNKLPVQHNV